MRQVGRDFYIHVYLREVTDLLRIERAKKQLPFAPEVFMKRSGIQNLWRKRNPEVVVLGASALGIFYARTQSGWGNTYSQSGV